MNDFAWHDYPKQIKIGGLVYKRYIIYDSWHKLYIYFNQNLFIIYVDKIIIMCPPMSYIAWQTVQFSRHWRRYRNLMKYWESTYSNHYLLIDKPQTLTEFKNIASDLIDQLKLQLL